MSYLSCVFKGILHHRVEIRASEIVVYIFSSCDLWHAAKGLALFRPPGLSICPCAHHFRSGGKIPWTGQRKPIPPRALKMKAFIACKDTDIFGGED